MQRVRSGSAHRTSQVGQWMAGARHCGSAHDGQLGHGGQVAQGCAHDLGHEHAAHQATHERQHPAQSQQDARHPSQHEPQSTEQSRGQHDGQQSRQVGQRMRQCSAASASSCTDGMRSQSAAPHAVHAGGHSDASPPWRAAAARRAIHSTSSTSSTPPIATAMIAAAGNASPPVLPVPPPGSGPDVVRGAGAMPAVKKDRDGVKRTGQQTRRHTACDAFATRRQVHAARAATGIHVAGSRAAQQHGSRSKASAARPKQVLNGSAGVPGAALSPPDRASCCAMMVAASRERSGSSGYSPSSIHAASSHQA
jgi:hypothetical protein